MLIMNQTQQNQTPEDTSPLVAIQRLLPEIGETRDKLKTMRDQLRDALTQNEEYQRVQEEIKELSTKRTEAKKLLLSDKDYQKLSAEVDDYRLKLKDLEEILSHYLVSYYEETKQTEITDDAGTTRQLILKAKIGKETA